MCCAVLYQVFSSCLLTSCFVRRMSRRGRPCARAVAVEEGPAAEGSRWRGRAGVVGGGECIRVRTGGGGGGAWLRRRGNAHPQPRTWHPILLFLFLLQQQQLLTRPLLLLLPIVVVAPASSRRRRRRRGPRPRLGPDAHDGDGGGEGQGLWSREWRGWEEEEGLRWLWLLLGQSCHACWEICGLGFMSVGYPNIKPSSSRNRALLRRRARMVESKCECRDASMDS